MLQRVTLGGLPLICFLAASIWLDSDFDLLALAVVIILTAEAVNFLEVSGLQRLNETPSPPAPTGRADMTAIIAAYLPNEQFIIEETMQHFLHLLSDGVCKKIVLSYNTPHNLPVIEELTRLARKEPRLILIHASSSITKAENINEALKHVTTKYVGIFDADSRPTVEAFRRAAAWLSIGHDFVQGANIPSKRLTSTLTNIVYVEYIIKYLVTYEGRHQAWNVSYFSGSNGYWRTDLVRQLQVEKNAQVEDIELALRALLAGANLKYDSLIEAVDEAPPSLSAWWSQRVRWAQGWAQLLRWHQSEVLTSGRINWTQRAVWTHFLLGRRILVPIAYFCLLALLTKTVLLQEPPPLRYAGSIIFILGAQWATQAWAIAQLFRHKAVWGPTVTLTRNWMLLYVAQYPLYELLRQITIIRASLALFKDPPTWNVTPRGRRSKTAQEAQCPKSWLWKL